MSKTKLIILTTTTPTSHLPLPMDLPNSVGGNVIFLVAQDKNVELSLTLNPFLFFIPHSQSLSKFCCLCLQNTFKNMTTSHHLHCHHSLQATTHFLSGLLQWPFHGFPCLYTCPTAVFSHLNRVVKVIQLKCEFFIPLLEILQWPVISE